MSVTKFLLSLTLMLFCQLSAQAQIKILNATGEELKVDVLHSSSQTRDVTISKDLALSAEIGPAKPRRTSLMLVLKSPSGQELARGEVFSEALVLLTKGSAGYNIPMASGFYKGPAEHGYIKVINGTQQDLHYSYEEPNFNLKTGKFVRETSDGKFMYQCKVMVTDGPFRPGQEVKVKLGVNEPAAGNGNPLVAGGVYFASLVDGKLKLTKVGND